MTQAQTTQVWADYTLNLPFAKTYLFSTKLSYHTIFSKESKLREVEVNPIIQWSIEELRPAIGLRYHFTPHRRIQLRGLVQLEQRNLYHNESSTWAHGLRPRLRLESIIPITRKTIFENKLWYGLLDAEFFWVMDNELDERYSNQMRFRAGIGYRSSYTWRFEVIYTDQFTRNKTEDC